MEVQLLHADAQPPRKKHPHDAAFDMYSCLTNRRPIKLYPGQRVTVPTGIAISTPVQTFWQIAPRSGLARDHGIGVLGGIGDCNYRGEIQVILINHGSEPFTIEHGERIAQLLVLPLAVSECRVVESLSTTDRADKGFGSSGMK